jgi:hypothetical protein
MITRRNILDLIGMHRGKYHSCILTCYSLDFSFFEERVLPTLRTVNIKNVNVFVDGKFLELAQDATTGHEFRFNKTYKFQPVYAKGVFHPKIMLLTGVKHGLLIIGSGNITSSGLSTNDEIWGAFHLNDVNNENSLLFAEVWNYLQQFINETYGFGSQQIEWIRKYSPWLAELPTSIGETYLESLNNYVSFICNSSESSIYQRLVKKIPNKNLIVLTIISPYYDQSGVLLKELKSYFQPGKFKCVLDLEYGLLPKDLDQETASLITFYDWSGCMKDFNEGVNRLHAKIFHFLFSDGTEYMMLGSANATTAALGSGVDQAINQEAGLIIRRTTSNKTWLEELDINLPDGTINLNSIPKNNHLIGQSEQRSVYTTRILYSELRGNELSVYINKEIKLANGYVVLFSRNCDELEKITYEQTNKILISKCKKPEDIFKVHLVDNSYNVISNYCIVHRVESLIKCNPDPLQEKLDNLFEQEYPDGEGITELLEFVEYNWADDETNVNISKHSRGGINHKLKEPSLTDKYETLNTEEFNTISDEMFLKQSGEMFHPSVKIAEFLGILGSELVSKSTYDYTESEEQKLLEDTEQKGEGSAITNKSSRKINALKERDAISRYFHKLDENYSEHLKSFYEEKALTVTPNQVINIKALSNVLIGLQLIQRYHGKKFDIEKGDYLSEGNVFRQGSYLIDGDVFSGDKTVKGFITNVLGKFLLLCTAGMKSYEYEILNQKIFYFRSQVVDKLVFTILNLHWHEKEYEYRDNLLLNSLFFINPESVSSEDFLNRFKQRIITARSKAVYISRYFDENADIFFNTFLPKFIKWWEKFYNLSLKTNLVVDTSTLFEGSVVFNRKIGFNLIYKMDLKGPSPRICFKRVGYLFDIEQKHYLWDKITFVNKCIVYV